MTMADTDVAKKEEQAVQATRTPETETTYIPDVDISETNECIRLVADMPGVDQASVDVSIEHNVLTIEGTAHCDAPEGCELVGQEYGIGRYRRDFTLADSVDTTGIKARVRHGVLELTLPKREEVKTRKIEIEA
jgi:HSP20 family molecular chaperone IbpA